MSVTPPPPGGGSGIEISTLSYPSVSAFTPPELGDNVNNAATDSEMNDAQQNANSLQGAQVIVDGLLCSIVKANSRSPIERDLVAAIERRIGETEIRESWWKLFNFFSDAYDESRKMKIKDIKHQLDIVTQ